MTLRQDMLAKGYTQNWDGDWIPPAAAPSSPHDSLYYQDSYDAQDNQTTSEAKEVQLNGKTYAPVTVGQGMSVDDAKAMGYTTAIEGPGGHTLIEVSDPAYQQLLSQRGGFGDIFKFGPLALMAGVGALAAAPVAAGAAGASAGAGGLGAASAGAEGFIGLGGAGGSGLAGGVAGYSPGLWSSLGATGLSDLYNPLNNFLQSPVVSTAKDIYGGYNKINNTMNTLNGLFGQGQANANQIPRSIEQTFGSNAQIGASANTLDQLYGMNTVLDNYWSQSAAQRQGKLSIY